MPKFFFVVIILSLFKSLHAVEGWIWFDKFPWVYDNQTRDWLYLESTPEAKLRIYRSSTKKWEEFGSSKSVDDEKSDWDKDYENWVNNPEDYGGLEVLQKIKETKERGKKELTLVGMNISDLAPLAGLTELNILNLEDNNISDLAPLAGLTNLNILNLKDNDINSTEPLAGLTELNILNLENNNISDVTPLAALIDQGGVSNLNLNSNSISDLSSFALWGVNKIHLIHLEDNNIKKDTNITPLLWAGYWIHLQGNELSPEQKKEIMEVRGLHAQKWWSDEKSDWDKDYENWVKNPENYGGLEVLQKIKETKETGKKELSLEGKNISDLAPLAGLTNLNILNLKDNDINSTEPLSGLTKLRELNLNNNSLSDLEPLTGLGNLEILSLDHNDINDLSPLSDLTNLRVLSLNYNKFTELNSLTGLKNLLELSLYGKNITDEKISFLNLEFVLPNTNVLWTQIYLKINDNREGPYDVETVNKRLSDRLADLSTLAWMQGMTDWEALSSESFKPLGLAP